MSLSTLKAKRVAPYGLATLLNSAKVRKSARYLGIRSEDGFRASVPINEVRDALVVYRLDDSPLPSSKGGPLRFLIPDVKDCAIGEVDACANIKNLVALEVQHTRGADSRPTNAREHEGLHKHGEQE